MEGGRGRAKAASRVVGCRYRPRWHISPVRGPRTPPKGCLSRGGRGRGDQLRKIWGRRLRALPAATSASGSAALASRRGPGQERVGESIRFEDSKKNEVARDHLKEVAMTQSILDDAVELVLWTA